MVATPATLVVEMPRHRAVNWPVAERTEMQRKLASLGTSITELSDARELLGLPRLSSATSEARRCAHYLLMSSKGQKTLAQVRLLREASLAALSELPRGLVSEAVAALRLRGSRNTWRLGELMAVVAQARALQILAE